MFPADRISFVDAISHIMMNYAQPAPQRDVRREPRALEEIMLRIEFLLSKFPHPRTIVVIDSVNSLAIHNPPDLLSEFFHILLNNLKSRQVLTLVLETSEEEPPGSSRCSTSSSTRRSRVGGWDADMASPQRIFGIPEIDRVWTGASARVARGALGHPGSGSAAREAVRSCGRRGGPGPVLHHVRTHGGRPKGVRRLRMGPRRGSRSSTSPS